MVAFSHLSMIAFVILGLSMVRLMINFSALLAKNYNDDGDPNESSSSQRDWTLVFRQTAPFFQDRYAWELHNEDDPSNDNYSILEQLEDFRGDDGKFHLKLVWPNPANDGTYLNLNQEWKQSSNPVNATGYGVDGYEAIDINYTSNSWGGLEYNSFNSSSLLDGTVNTGNWFYAVGSSGDWGGGIPGPAGPAVSQVELYVKSNVISGCDYNDDGGVDVIDLVSMIDCILIEGCFDGSQCD